LQPVSSLESSSQKTFGDFTLGLLYTIETLDMTRELMNHSNLENDNNSIFGKDKWKGDKKFSTKNKV